MQIPDEIRKCVVFVGYVSKDGPRLAGTAFIVTVKEDIFAGKALFFGYVVTAKHTIVAISNKSADGLVYLRINRRDGSFASLPTKIDDWISHPDDTSVDVAVLPWMPDEKVFDFLTWPFDQFVTPARVDEERVSAGDEVFMAGLFASHYGRQRNVPVIRAGNISCMPEEKVETRVFGPIDAYIIEARSIGGLSGSPVFLFLDDNRVIQSGGGLQRAIGRGTRIYLLGLVHGHWDVSDRVQDELAEDDIAQREGRINMGMAIVVPAHKIAETINQQRLVDGRLGTLERHRKEQST